MSLLAGRRGLESGPQLLQCKPTMHRFFECTYRLISKKGGYKTLSLFLGPQNLQWIEMMGDQRPWAD
jgi:hypothetical protein